MLPLPPKSKLGRFEVEERMSAAHGQSRGRAWDPELGAHVELTVFDERAALERAHELTKRASELMPRRFRRVLDASDPADPVSWLSIECLEGRTLADRLLDKELRAAEISLLAMSLAETVAALHAAGMAHGALRPENVFLVDGAVDRWKLDGLGDGAFADPGNDVLDLARLLVLASNAPGRRGAGRRRGWDRATAAGGHVERFLRRVLGKDGTEANAEDTLRAFEAWLAEMATSRQSDQRGAESQGSAVLLIRAPEADGGSFAAGVADALTALAAKKGVATASYADGTVSGSVSTARRLVDQLATLADFACEWAASQPFGGMGLTAEKSDVPSSVEPYLRSVELLPRGAFVLVDPHVERMIVEARSETPLARYVVIRSSRAAKLRLRDGPAGRPALLTLLVIALFMGVLAASVAWATKRTRLRASSQASMNVGLRGFNQ